MATGADRLPQSLDCTNLAKEWPRWKQKFNIYMIANNKADESERNKIATFLWLVGEHGVEIYNTLFPNNGDTETMFGEVAALNNQPAAEPIAGVAVVQERTLAEVIIAFDTYCLPRKNLAVEAFKFNTIAQKEKQPFTEFETALRTQLAFCEFECEACHVPFADRMLRDRIIIGIQDKKLQLKLLDGKNEPLVNIVEICKTYEAAAENKQLLERNEVHTVIENRKEGNVVPTAMCFKCGQPFNGRHSRYCPANNVVCDGCGRRGHFRKYCKSTKYDSKRNCYIEDNKGNTQFATERLPRTSKHNTKQGNNVHMLNWADAE
ncbi:uncharacterized protein LOC131437045 [Malaya genurostris]|uniref:uncharacterized protein LOC131431426 n=1 Tax=Malaya genurostris TaxID=325434 RepID=UPI0026F40311|nr:uncharacterized protein LOC131431426 [Malaya genurostris]XP_058462074.1 uncharacterized protein LOC131437045 [Malaya genurostris]